MRSVDAKKRLALIVPLSLLLILMLLYSLFNSIRDSLLALSGIPFAVAGGILGLYVGGLNFSVSAAVGFISLFGVSAMDGILLMSYIRRDIEEGHGDGGGHHPRFRNKDAADLHDRAIGVYRPGPGGDLDRDRFAGPAAAGVSHRWRDAAVADLQPAGHPGAGKTVDANDQGHRDA